MSICVAACAWCQNRSLVFMFFNSGYAHDRNISIFRRRALRVTGNTLIKPKYASVRQSKDSLHRSGGARKISLPGHNRGTIISNGAHFPCREAAPLK